MSFLMRRRSRGSFQPVCSEHRIPAYYLGKHPAKGKVGLGVVRGPVAVLFKQFRESMGKRVLLEVQNEGLWIKPTGEGTGGRLVRRHTTESESNAGSRRSNNSFIIPVDDISFGAIDTNHRKVFTIIVRQTQPNAEHPWECHAFLCNSHAEAKHLTLKLVATFQKLAQARGLEVGSSSNPNTMHVFTESLSPTYESSTGNVTTLKITFNVEQVDANWSKPTVYNRNRQISQILSEKESLSNGVLPPDDEPVEVQEEEEVTPRSVSSDKENEGSDSGILEAPTVKPRTSVVAVNTGITQLTAVQDDGSDEDQQTTPTSSIETIPPADNAVPVDSPKPKSRTKPKKKSVRFTAEISYIE